MRGFVIGGALAALFWALVVTLFLAVARAAPGPDEPPPAPSMLPVPASGPSGVCLPAAVLQQIFIQAQTRWGMIDPVVLGLAQAASAGTPCALPGPHPLPSRAPDR